MVSDSSITPTLLAGQPTQLDADALLQASRRVDWRFLLPDPNLAHVAYIGPARGALAESLRLFSAELTLIGPTTDVVSGQYDVVVAHAPSAGVLRQAAGLLKPGGWLYIEAYGPFRRRNTRPGRGLRYAAEYIAAIGQLGLVEAAAYWHWPNFESCAEIVPLSDQNALLLAFARRRGGAAARLKSGLGRVLLRSGMFARLAPCFSIVAQKP
jgi:SAM-dependent methyltransferase